jgi:predicted ATPase
MPPPGFLKAVTLVRDRVPSFERYPFSVPAIRAMETLDLHPKVTFFIGDNGTGKSTLLEAVAVKAGFNAEGGSKNFRFETRRSESELHQAYEDTEQFQITRDFLVNREAYLHPLLAD